MEWIQIVEVIAVSIGLLGIFCFGKYIADTFFLPRQIRTAVAVFDDESKENADILIHILKKGIWRMADRRICVLISERYADDAELMDMIVSSGAEYCIVKEI